MMFVAPSIFPQWIAKMYLGKTGRDHLGLGSVSSDQILPSLSPSINVLTFHPRYHSFYVFLLDEYWQRVPEKSYQHWKDFFRPRAYIYSLGVHLHNDAHGELRNIVGGRKVGPMATQALDGYPTQFDYIDSELGGYGLYYRTVMAELGLIYPGGRGLPMPVDVPSEFGRRVAEAFRQSIKQTTYYQKYFAEDDTEVPINAIREYIQHACLCQLKNKSTPDRPLMLETFLRQGITSEAAARRATFRMLLDMAEQTHGFALDEDIFRQLIYFQRTQDGPHYTPQSANLETFVRWRLYQAREYYAFALNALWYQICEWGIRMGGELHPIPLSSLWWYLESSFQFDGLFAHVKQPVVRFTAQSSLRQLLAWLRQFVTGDETNIEQAYSLDKTFQEHVLYQLASKQHTPDLIIPGMVLLLLLISLRLEDESLRYRKEWEINQMGMNGRLSLDWFLRQLNHFLDSGPVTIGEFLRWIVRDYILIQHQAVATSKLPDNTFRFQQQGDRLQFFLHDNSLDFMNSRFEALATTIYELGLCGDLRTPDHTLTEDGVKLLQDGYL